MTSARLRLRQPEEGRSGDGDHTGGDQRDGKRESTTLVDSKSRSEGAYGCPHAERAHHPCVGLSQHSRGRHRGSAAQS